MWWDGWDFFTSPMNGKLLWYGALYPLSGPTPYESGLVGQSALATRWLISEKRMYCSLELFSLLLIAIAISSSCSSGSLFPSSTKEHVLTPSVHLKMNRHYVSQFLDNWALNKKDGLLNLSPFNAIAPVAQRDNPFHYIILPKEQSPKSSLLMGTLVLQIPFHGQSTVGVTFRRPCSLTR